LIVARRIFLPEHSPASVLPKTRAHDIICTTGRFTRSGKQKPLALKKLIYQVSVTSRSISSGKYIYRLKIAEPSSSFFKLRKSRKEVTRLFP